MQIFRLTSGLCVLLFALFWSCQSEPSPGDDALKFVPSESISVTGINMASLLEKADFDAMRNMSFFRNTLEEVRGSDPVLAGFLEDPWSTGIDLESPIYLVQQINTDNPSEFSMAIMASVADPERVAEMMALVDGDWEDGQGFRYSVQPGGVVAWNDELVLFGSGDGTQIVTDHVNRIFNTPPESSLATHPEAGKFANERHDVKTMISLDVIPEISDAAMALSLSGISPNSLKGAHSFGYLDFGNGAIDGRANWYFDKEFSKHFAPFFKDEPTRDLSALLPASGQVMAMTGALSPEGIHLFLSERPQYKSMVSYSLKGAGLKLDDVLKAFGGDMAFGLYTEDGILVADIKDRTIFGNILDAGLRLGIISDDGNGMYQLTGNGMTDGSLHLLVKDNLVYAGTDRRMMEGIADGSVKASGAGSGNSSLMSLNMNLVGMRWFLSGIGASTSEIDDVIRLFGDMEVDVTVNRTEMKMLAEMDNKSDNVLALLVQELEKAYQADN